MATNSNKKKDISTRPKGGTPKVLFLEQLVSLKYVLGWGASIFVFFTTLSYHVGKWMQETDDKFVIHQKQEELNDTRTQLTLEYNEKIIKLERENSKLESLLEICQGKEVENGKKEL